MADSTPVALVTGATNGIGKATCRVLKMRGYDVLFTGRNAARGAELESELRRLGGAATFLQTTLSNESSCQALVDSSYACSDRIDLLVNNAGFGIGGGTSTMSEEIFDYSFALNVKVPFFLVSKLSPRWRNAVKAA
nr:SDR family NAD(P)-dependent oxidoreductase [Mycobacterium adipatum]